MPRKGGAEGSCRGQSSAGLTIQVASASGSASAASACAGHLAYLVLPARQNYPRPPVSSLSVPVFLHLHLPRVALLPTQPPSKHMHPSVTSPFPLPSYWSV